MDTEFRIDIDAMLTDHVKDAELITGSDANQVSRHMFGKAAAAVAVEGSSGSVVFVECNPRQRLLESIASEHSIDALGLERISVKYVASADMLRALLAAWHCAAEPNTEGLTEMDFLLVEKKQTDGPNVHTPDYIFIDGIDAIASEKK
ncbi:hypothetical protein COEREDRAFT_85162 [Coemansia reversa NRRL 1564]|uniref:Uncharacterized protein n=1 Tax=Coemansia reversa (strain ATCC 12441 / NRRL 1564) TaxID=763665 RepID=A0A2G5BI56_COERN|nr:hypothetical protein COEREDRAFT_85162 [Coemansia reversa NRRL 1564]|eukprot:PIA18708.1 hypothetical protein COEREDRAFT_85162 [Coemansia reversa NRRL 1564]